MTTANSKNNPMHSRIASRAHARPNFRRVCRARAGTFIAACPLRALRWFGIIGACTVSAMAVTRFVALGGTSARDWTRASFSNPHS
jgi:hypothetical protein